MKELTFGEAVEMLKALKADLGREPEQMEILAYAYEKGVAAGNETTTDDDFLKASGLKRVGIEGLKPKLFRAIKREYEEENGVEVTDEEIKEIFKDHTYIVPEVQGEVCPKCGNFYTEPPAISREDNQTEICPECGQREAIEAYENYLKKKGAAEK